MAARAHPERVARRTWPVASQQRVDAVEHAAARRFETRVLALMLDPRADEERLDEQVGVFEIAIEMPADGARTAARAAQLARGVDELLGVSRRERIFDRHENRSLLDRTVDLRQRQRLGHTAPPRPPHRARQA